MQCTHPLAENTSRIKYLKLEDEPNQQEEDTVFSMSQLAQMQDIPTDQLERRQKIYRRKQEQKNLTDQMEQEREDLKDQLRIVRDIARKQAACSAFVAALSLLTVSAFILLPFASIICASVSGIFMISHLVKEVRSRHQNRKEISLLEKRGALEKLFIFSFFKDASLNLLPSERENAKGCCSCCGNSSGDCASPEALMVLVVLAVMFLIITIIVAITRGPIKALNSYVNLVEQEKKYCTSDSLNFNDDQASIAKERAIKNISCYKKSGIAIASLVLVFACFSITLGVMQLAVFPLKFQAMNVEFLSRIIGTASPIFAKIADISVIANTASGCGALACGVIALIMAALIINKFLLHVNFISEKLKEFHYQGDTITPQSSRDTRSVNLDLDFSHAAAGDLNYESIPLVLIVKSANVDEAAVTRGEAQSLV